MAARCDEFGQDIAQPDLRTTRVEPQGRLQEREHGRCIQGAGEVIDRPRPGRHREPADDGRGDRALAAVQPVAAQAASGWERELDRSLRRSVRQIEAVQPGCREVAHDALSPVQLGAQQATPVFVFASGWSLEVPAGRDPLERPDFTADSIARAVQPRALS